ncbi:MAG: ATP-binding protein [Bacteroidales bacterium]|jgi:predicted AAA+ superfamily ATPase|nr:ATP-binding protein [Bacteroidales bacterium]MBP5396584.1 ATP-binding protein [Bacteroidales bacterium]MBQ6667521.1 ATP-binding protein [Bacteroidales bacterium]MBR4340985.1 ATP-binding protein [Bacteroidales bacterium]MBR6920536.1 ATP-binding protein [Bacteroidales bacterium]
MIKRILQINNELDGSIFLFGARQTGKTTALLMQFPNAIYIDLLDTDIKNRYMRRPAILYELLQDKPEQTLVIIDEIAEVPELLNEVHRLIVRCNHIFILCGSSARKLKRKGRNTLGGRALPVYMYPLVSAEIPDFDIDHAVCYGMVPSHYLAKNPSRRLAAYIDIYLKEEIKEEALVRNLSVFQRFLEVAALTDGEIVNNNNIAQDCGISAVTVSAYFDILVDTLIGYRIPAFRKVMKRRLVQAPKFYYFDIGVANHLLHRKDMVRGSADYGHAFEHLVIQELYAWLHYTHSEEELFYWRTYTGLEVDAVIGDARVAIEIKSVEEVMNKHLKGLKAFGEEYPQSRRIIVSLDMFNRRMGEIECVYVLDFFKRLWSEGV